MDDEISRNLVIYNVYKFMEKEKLKGEAIIPFNRIYDRVAKAVGLSLRQTRRIILVCQEEEENENEKNHPLHNKQDISHNASFLQNGKSDSKEAVEEETLTNKDNKRKTVNKPTISKINNLSKNSRTKRTKDAKIINGENKKKPEVLNINMLKSIKSIEQRFIAYTEAQKQRFNQLEDEILKKQENSSIQEEFTSHEQKTNEDTKQNPISNEKLRQDKKHMPAKKNISQKMGRKKQVNKFTSDNSLQNRNLRTRTLRSNQSPNTKKENNSLRERKRISSNNKNKTAAKRKITQPKKTLHKNEASDDVNSKNKSSNNDKNQVDHFNDIETEIVSYKLDIQTNEIVTSLPNTENLQPTKTIEGASAPKKTKKRRKHKDCFDYYSKKTKKRHL